MHCDSGSGSAKAKSCCSGFGSTPLPMTRKEPSYTEPSLSCWFPVCFDHVDEESERLLFRDGDGSEVPGNTF
jgi:hypothetical protein